MGILEWALLVAIGVAIVIYVLRTEDSAAATEEIDAEPAESNVNESTEQS